MDPSRSIINLQVKMRTAQVANKRLNEIFTIESEKTGDFSFGGISSQIFQKGITLKNAFLSYNTKARMLNNISCMILPKSKIALVGVSGSGKSILAKLLVSFYALLEGVVCCGKMNRLDVPFQQLQKHVIYVP